MVVQEDRSGTVVPGDPLEESVQYRSELDAVDILVRESSKILSMLDRKIAHRCPSAFTSFSRVGKRRNEILEAADFESLANHQCIEPNTEGQSSRFADPDSVRSHDDLVLLYVKGLWNFENVGPEFKKRDGDATSLDPQCFVGLCRAIGMNERRVSRARRNLWVRQGCVLGCIVDWNSAIPFQFSITRTV